MRKFWYAVSWLGLALGVMLMVGGALGVWVIGRDERADDPWFTAAINVVGEQAPSQGFQLGKRSLVLGSGLFMLGIPGAISSSRKPVESSQL